MRKKRLSSHLPLALRKAGLPTPLTLALASGLAALALLSACGSGSSQMIPTRFSTTDAPGASSLPDTRGIPDATFAAMLGQYEGEMYGVTESGQSYRQDYRFTLSERPEEGRRYAFLQFRSSGPLGNIGLDAYLGVVFVDFSGKYRFVSGARQVDALSASPIQVQLDFATANGSPLPAQSMIRFMDCGFSQTVCNNPLLHVWFANGFRKR
jgi:hypothetical protein